MFFNTKNALKLICTPNKIKRWFQTANGKKESNDSDA